MIRKLIFMIIPIAREGIIRVTRKLQAGEFLIKVGAKFYRTVAL